MVPRPSLPVAESKRKPPMPASPKRMVEEAERPPVSKSNVEVEFAVMPNEVVGVQLKVPLPDPQATPVLLMRPIVEKVAQPAVPPALETTRLVVLAVPEMVRAVVEA